MILEKNDTSLMSMLGTLEGIVLICSYPSSTLSSQIIKIHYVFFLFQREDSLSFSSPSLSQFAGYLVPLKWQVDLWSSCLINDFFFLICVLLGVFPHTMIYLWKEPKEFPSVSYIDLSLNSEQSISYQLSDNVLLLLFIWVCICVSIFCVCAYHCYQLTVCQTASYVP